MFGGPARGLRRTSSSGALSKETGLRRVARRFAQRAETVAGTIDRIGLQAGKQFISLAHSSTRRQSSDECGVAGKSGFGEDDKLRALSGGFGHQLDGARHGTFKVKEDRRLLDNGGFHLLAL